MDGQPAWQAYTPVWFIVLVLLGSAFVFVVWVMPSAAKAEQDCLDRGGQVVEEYIDYYQSDWSCIGPDGAEI